MTFILARNDKMSGRPRNNMSQAHIDATCDRNRALDS